MGENSKQVIHKIIDKIAVKHKKRDITSLIPERCQKPEIYHVRFNVRVGDHTISTQSWCVARMEEHTFSRMAGESMTTRDGKWEYV